MFELQIPTPMGLSSLPRTPQHAASTNAGGAAPPQAAPLSNPDSQLAAQLSEVLSAQNRLLLQVQENAREVRTELRESMRQQIETTQRVETLEKQLKEVGHGVGGLADRFLRPRGDSGREREKDIPQGFSAGSGSSNQGSEESEDRRGQSSHARARSSGSQSYGRRSSKSHVDERGDRERDRDRDRVADAELRRAVGGMRGSSGAQRGGGGGGGGGGLFGGDMQLGVCGVVAPPAQLAPCTVTTAQPPAEHRHKNFY